MLQCCFEQQIQEKCRAIQKRAMEEAVASKWLISNDTQLGLQMDEAFRRHKATTREQTRRFLEYSRRLKEEKQLEEKRREDAFEVTATNICQTTEAKQAQLREASRALEKEVREMQFEQMQKREQVRPTQPDGCPSFLDKMFARDAMESRRMELAKHQYHLDLLLQIHQRSGAATSMQQESECCDFTRPFATSQDDSGTYAHLNPLRRIATSQS
uniref:Uncharacterized protein n=1 Tax=Mesocestoides corti TaxID=53468 RepID=A0A5K3FR04_MESCO